LLPTVTQTALPPPTVSPTLEPSPTITPSPTLQATPAYALITSSAGGGALVRTEPGAGTVITPLSNGLIVEVLPEIQDVDTVVWVRVRLANNIQGWVLQTVLTATALTPTPIPTPSPTP
jgi:hypothetical protein